MCSGVPLRPRGRSAPCAPQPPRAATTGRQPSSRSARAEMYGFALARNCTAPFSIVIGAARPHEAQRGVRQPRREPRRARAGTRTTWSRTPSPAAKRSRNPRCVTPPSFVTLNGPVDRGPVEGREHRRRHVARVDHAQRVVAGARSAARRPPMRSAAPRAARSGGPLRRRSRTGRSADGLEPRRPRATRHSASSASRFERA